MTVPDALLARLRREGLDIPAGSALRRVYASRASRNAGAWSWFAVGPDGSELKVGSQHSMRDLLSCSSWYVFVDTYGDTWIDPSVG